ncbi:MAG: hypothetical protein WBQ75_07825 [Acetobacteraceae bacterium]
MAHSSITPTRAPPDAAESPKGKRPSLPVRVFQFPGNVVANLLKATADDDRMAIRVLIDMLAWNVVVVVIAVIAFTHFG